MSISSEILRLEGAKADIIDAIEAKGVTVPSGAKLDDLAALIEDIESGGGGGEVKFASGESDGGGQIVVTGLTFTPLMVAVSYLGVWYADEVTLSAMAVNPSLANEYDFFIVLYALQNIGDMGNICSFTPNGFTMTAPLGDFDFTVWFAVGV